MCLCQVAASIFIKKAERIFRSAHCECNRKPESTCNALTTRMLRQFASAIAAVFLSLSKAAF